MKLSVLSGLLCLFCWLSLYAELGPHPVIRVRMGETDEAVLYKDKLSDNTYRNSQIAKPRPPEYPERVSLVATNGTPVYWELVYEAVYAGGRVSTNYQAVLKSKRDKISGKLVLPPLPQSPTNLPAVTDALALAKKRFKSEIGAAKEKGKKGAAFKAWLAEGRGATNVITRMALQIPRVASAKVDGGNVVRIMTDGTVNTAPLRHAYTARVTASSPSQKNGSVNSKAAKSAGAGAVLGALATYAAMRRQTATV